jgi:hypothetical protein
VRKHYESHAEQVAPGEAIPMFTFSCPQCGPDGLPYLKPTEVAHEMYVHVAERHPSHPQP